MVSKHDLPRVLYLSLSLSFFHYLFYLSGIFLYFLLIEGVNIKKKNLTATIFKYQNPDYWRTKAKVDSAIYGDEPAKISRANFERDCAEPYLFLLCNCLRYFYKEKKNIETSHYLTYYLIERKTTNFFRIQTFFFSVFTKFCVFHSFNKIEVNYYRQW